MGRIIPILDRVIVVTLFIFVAFSMFSISITQVAGGLGGLAWLVRTQLANDWNKQNWSLGIPIALFALASLIAVIDAYDVRYSFPPLKKLLEFLIFFWIVNCIRNNNLRDQLSLLLIVAATLASLYGFYQGWRDGVNLMNRVEGTMSVYMTFAGLIMMVGLVALGRVLFRSPRENWLWSAILIIFICLLMTFTRQAWLGFLVGICFIGYIRQKKYFLIGTTLIISLVVLIAVFMRPQVESMLVPNAETFIEHLKNRVSSMVSGRDSTYNMRLELWQVGWEIFRDYPLTGCGFRCVDLLNAQYPDSMGIVNRLRGMHNNFMQLAVDTGILGLGAWLSIWFYFFRLLHRKKLALDGAANERWVIFASAAAVLAFLVGGCFESNLYDSEVMMVLYFIMALPFAGSEYRRSH